MKVKDSLLAIKNSKSVLAFFTIWLFVVQITFYLIQKNQGLSLTNSIHSQLRQELDVSNFNIISRSLTDLDSIGTINCVRLEIKTGLETWQKVLDLTYRSKCNLSPIFLYGADIDTTLISLNGDIFHLRYKTKNTFVFDLALWILRIFGFIFILGVYFFLNFKNNQKQIFNELERKHNAELFEIASQISHDIRSPLSALNIVVNSLQEIPEDSKILIKNAIQRINEIANDVLLKSKKISHKSLINSESTNFSKKPELIASIVDQIISEKRLQYSEKNKIQIHVDLLNSHGGFVECIGSDLKRILSNLVNNSIESFKENIGEVTVSVRTYAQSVQIIISDNGCGISQENLSRLGEKGFTGEKDGNGLGIYHARKTIEELDGKFDVFSTLDVGTTVMMTLKRAETPLWFAENLTLTESIDKRIKVVILDDDITIHKIWDGIFKLLPDLTIEILSFTQVGEFIEFCKNNELLCSQMNFLIDYEFVGHSKNGLELIESLNLNRNATLVTSRFEDEEVLNKSMDLGVRILPKSLISTVILLSKSQDDHGVGVDV